MFDLMTKLKNKKELSPETILDELLSVLPSNFLKPIIKHDQSLFVGCEGPNAGAGFHGIYPNRYPFIGYNTEFLNAPIKEQYRILSHELAHIILGHPCLTERYLESTEARHVVEISADILGDVLLEFLGKELSMETLSKDEEESFSHPCGKVREFYRGHALAMFRSK